MGRKLNIHLMNLYNQSYFEAFMTHLSPQSQPAYRCTIGKFLEHLGVKDAAITSIKDILNYTHKVYELKHIKSFLIFIVKNNLNGCLINISKELLVWLI